VCPSGCNNSLFETITDINDYQKNEKSNEIANLVPMENLSDEGKLF